MAENQFTSTIDTLFRGMDQFVNTKTVVGEPVQVGDTIIVPLVDVTCGMAAGSFAEGVKQKQRGGGGVTKLVNVKNQDAITKVIDMAPDFINKFLGGKPAVSEETVQTAKDTAAAYDTGKAEHMDVK